MTTYTVSTAAQLQAALSSALGGDSILLASGEYGVVSISGRQYSSTVKLEAALGASVHLDGLRVTGSANLSVSGVDLGRPLAAGEASFVALNSISDSTNIEISNSTIHGSLDGDPGNDGRGLSIMNGTNIQVDGCYFSDLSVGLIQQRSSFVSISNNHFRVIQSDGIDSSVMSGVSISGNTFSDFSPKDGDHPDAIQFFNSNQPTGSKDITIQDNVIYQGSGTGTQGIFFSTPGLGFTNVLIKNNLVYSNEQYNGIAVTGAHGLQVLDNTVISRSDDGKFQKIWVNTSDHVIIAGNVAEEITIAKDGTDAVLFDNLNLAQNPDARNALTFLNNPSSPEDLIFRDHGFKMPTPPNASSAILSSVIGSELTSHQTSDSTGSYTTDTALDILGEYAAPHVVPHLLEMPASVPSDSSFSAQPASGAVLGHSWMPQFEHYVALP